jgi:hypothetical protein
MGAAVNQVASLLDCDRIGRIAAWKARRLTKARTRERLAAAVERTVRAAETRAQTLSSAIPIHGSAVLGARPQLAVLADRLRAPEPVYAQGVVLVASLLSNSDSPLYQVESDLGSAVEGILSALDGHFR